MAWDNQALARAAVLRQPDHWVGERRVEAAGPRGGGGRWVGPGARRGSHHPRVIAATHRSSAPPRQAVFFVLMALQCENDKVNPFSQLGPWQVANPLGVVQGLENKRGGQSSSTHCSPNGLFRLEAMSSQATARIPNGVGQRACAGDRLGGRAGWGRMGCEGRSGGLAGLFYSGVRSARGRWRRKQRDVLPSWLSSNLSRHRIGPLSRMAAPTSQHPEFHDVTHRYPGLSGRMLQDKVRAEWVIAENVTLKFFVGEPSKDPGAALLSRHALNDRDQHSTRAIYREKIKEVGISKGARNEALAVPLGHLCHTKLQVANVTLEIPAAFVGGAHLMEAAYEAWFEPGSESNPQVLTSMRAGLPNVTLLDSRTPPDVLSWLKDGANLFNELASGIDFLERYKATTAIAAAWVEERQSKRARLEDGGAACNDYDDACYDDQVVLGTSCLGSAPVSTKVAVGLSVTCG